jgi:hypothetical protein
LRGNKIPQREGESPFAPTPAISCRGEWQFAHWDVIFMQPPKRLIFLSV